MPALFQTQNWPSQMQGLFQARPNYVAEKKPIDAVLARIALVLVLLAGAMLVVALPLCLLLDPWKAAATAIGLAMIYGGASLFSKTQIEDELDDTDPTPELIAERRRRVLLHLAFAPGRFAAEALLDACLLIKLAGSRHAPGPAAESAADEPESPATGPDDAWRS